MNTIYKVIGLNIIVVFILSSCVPAAVVTTGVVGTTIAGERTAGDRLNDNIIKLKVNEAYIQAETGEIYSSVNVNVHEGRVLLTGAVKNKDYLNEAAAIAWKIKGVKEVINEIEVADKTFKDSAKDILIANTIRGKILLEKDVISVNYLVDVSNSVVYLLGVAQSEKELDAVLQIAGTVRGVQKVVSHVLLKEDKRRLPTNFD